jgi:hypothetical protein
MLQDEVAKTVYSYTGQFVIHTQKNAIFWKTIIESVLWLFLGLSKSTNFQSTFFVDRFSHYHFFKLEG